MHKTGDGGERVREEGERILSSLPLSVERRMGSAPMTAPVSPQLGCLPEPFFPFLRPCWIPGVQRSQQSKAGETLAGVPEPPTLRNVTC